MLEVWQDARLYHALARGMIVAGQLMWIETMGGHVAQAQGVVIVGSSNWAADTSLKGIVHDLTVLSATSVVLTNPPPPPPPPQAALGQTALLAIAVNIYNDPLLQIW
jgi:hypothetical protein